MIKIPALFAAAVALSACSTATSPTGQSEESALTPLEANDIAAAPTAAEQNIEPAKALTGAPNTAATQAPSGEAVCSRGTLNDEIRSFIICENGTLRKAGVVAALSAPHDPALKIEDVSATYNVPTQIFTGIESATYGSLVNGNRQAPRGGAKPRAQTGLVQIEGKVYEVYQLSSDGKSGTIFVEQKSDK